MSLRVDSVQLPQDCPLGASRMHGLHDFDLIVVEGPNGSGKSTLLAPIGGPARGATVICRAANGEAVDAPVQRVRREITRRNSIELMERFTDLREALAMAADATRPQHEAKLLQRISRDIAEVEIESDDAPPELATARTNYLQLDSRLDPTMPRTLAEYRSRGAALAARAGDAWECPVDLTDLEGRVAAEVRLSPRPFTIAGWDACRRILARLPPATDARVSAAALLCTKRAELLALAAAACDAIHQPTSDLPAADSPLGALLEAAQKTGAELTAARNAIGDQLAALDVLRECRDRARKYLGTPQARQHATLDCPVCGGECHHDTLSSRLDQLVGAPDEEAAALQAQRGKCGDLIQKLERSLRETRDLGARADHEHASLRHGVDALLQQHAATASWDAEVRRRLDDARGRCTAWTNAHAGGPSVAAIESYADIRAFVDEALSGFDGIIEREGARLAEHRGDFERFRQLGEVLAAQQALDRIPWRASLERREASVRKARQRALWIEVLGELAAERETVASGAIEAVHQDEKVQALFAALLERLPGHSEIRNLRFAGARLEAGASERQGKLSEGQTVLVNIAAMIAVASKLHGHASHAPGFIVLDEPTNGLDAESRNAVAAFLGGLSREDYPGQIFVATFDGEFGSRLVAAAATSQRRTGVIRLKEFVRGVTMNLTPATD